MRFVFVDDDGVTLQSVKPCPVSKAFVDDFTVRCKSCAYTVNCIDCGVELLDSGSLQDHMLLFEQTHVLTSRSIVSKVKTKNNFVVKRVWIMHLHGTHFYIFEIWDWGLDCRKFTYSRLQKTFYVFLIMQETYILCNVLLCFFSILHLNN